MYKTVYNVIFKFQFLVVFYTFEASCVEFDDESSVLNLMSHIIFELLRKSNNQSSNGTTKVPYCDPVYCYRCFCLQLAFSSHTFPKVQLFKLLAVEMTEVKLV